MRVVDGTSSNLSPAYTYICACDSLPPKGMPLIQGVLDGNADGNAGELW
jgi:hypothetical protein